MLWLKFGLSSVFFLLSFVGKANCTFFPYVPSNPNKIRFNLYPNPNNKSEKDELMLDNVDSIKSSKFNPDLPTVLMIHGFWNDEKMRFPKMLKDAYLDSSPVPTKNYIVVDWSQLSRIQGPPMSYVLYPIAYPIVVTRNIPIVSRRIANFIRFMIKEEFMSPEKTHLVGHSLGAHISGYVGHLLEYIHSTKNGIQKIARISGLDPAGPGFSEQIPFQRIMKKTDAEFVDIYHTASGTRGISINLGTADFYANGGGVQPGCPEDGNNLPPLPDLLAMGSCSHEYVVNIFAATITQKIQGCRCSPSLDKQQLINCMEQCPDSLIVGENCPPNAKGIYYFTTGAELPDANEI